MGLVVPRIRIIDNMRLEPSEYCFKIRGVQVGRGIIRLGLLPGDKPGRSHRGHTRREDAGPDLRPARPLDSRGAARQDREGGLYRRRRAQHRRDPPYRHNQEARLGDTRQAGGPVDPRRAQEGLSGRRRGRDQAPQPRRDAEGAAGPPARAGVGPQHGGHPRDSRRLRGRDEGSGLPGRKDAGRRSAGRYASNTRIRIETLRVLTIDPALEQKIIDSQGRYPGRSRRRPRARRPAAMDQGSHARRVGGTAKGLGPHRTVLGGRARPRQGQHREGAAGPRRPLGPGDSGRRPSRGRRRDKSGRLGDAVFHRTGFLAPRGARRDQGEVRRLGPGAVAQDA